jgi:hypothetical protein
MVSPKYAICRLASPKSAGEHRVGDDIPLPSGLPAAAQRRLSRLWPVNDRFQSTSTANHYPLSAANDAIPVRS